MKRLFAAFSALSYLAFAGFATASPLPYINAPLDTVQAAANAVIASINANSTPQATLTTCTTATTTATCSGLRFTLSVTGLTTAAGAASSNIVVTDTGFVTTSSQVFCNTGTYAGTGIPNVELVTVAANSITLYVVNSSSSAALSATVPIFCQVYN
jgi:hypothetical protein